jgi:hypothetical protein
LIKTIASIKSLEREDKNMKKNISKNDSKHFSGDRTVVTFDEKVKWIELWPGVRKRVASNDEAFKELAGLGLRYRDWRTVRNHIEKLLPLVNTNAVSAVIDLVNFCESRLPIKESLQLIKERLPIEEVQPKLTHMAEVLIKDVPPPGEVLQALGSILSGGYPFDPGKGKK